MILNNVIAGVDTSDATATAADIRDGVTAYVDGEKITGSLSTISQTKATVNTGYVEGRTACFDLNFKADMIVPNGHVLKVQHTPDADSNIITKFITSISVTGSNATSTYYNTDFGVQIAYLSNTACVVMMRGGTSTSYEHIYFETPTLPSGVTYQSVEGTNFWNGTSDNTGYLYAIIIRGFDSTQTYSLVANMSGRDSTDDSVSVTFTITQN